MIALLLLACTDPGAGHLAGTTVTEAWIDDFSWGSFTLVAGPIGGGGRLRARTVEGEVIGQHVQWDGVAVGIGEIIGGGGMGRVNLTLPASTVPGECLLGDFEGSLETLAVGAGYSELRLRNVDGVEIDDGGVAIFMAIGVFFVSVELRVATHEKWDDDIDTAESGWDSGADSAADSGGDDSAADSAADSAGDTAGDSGDDE